LTTLSSLTSVGIPNRYGLHGPGIESRWGEIFRAVQTDREAHTASCTMGTGFSRDKAARAWCWQTTSFYFSFTCAWTGMSLGDLYL